MRLPRGVIRDSLDFNCFARASCVSRRGEPSLFDALGQSELDLYQSRLFVSESQELLGSPQLPPGFLELLGPGFVHQQTAGA